MPKLESVEVVLVHCNLVQMIVNTHLKYYLILCQANNSFKLINISPHSLITMNTVNT